MCISSLTGTTRVPLASNWTTSRSGNLPWASHGTICSHMLNHHLSHNGLLIPTRHQPLYLSGFGLSPMRHSTNVEQPVDAFVDSLIKGQETFFLGLEAKIY